MCFATFDQFNRSLLNRNINFFKRNNKINLTDPNLLNSSYNVHNLKFAEEEGEKGYSNTVS